MTKRDSSEHGKTPDALALEYAVARGEPEAELCLRYRLTRRQLRAFIDDMQGHADREVPAAQGRRTA